MSAALFGAELSHAQVLLGCMIMLSSCCITSAANVLMKKDANATRIQTTSSGFVMTRKYVMLAVLLYIIGGLGDFACLAFIPLSIRAVSSCLTIPFNAVLAFFLLNESMTKIQMAGATVTVLATFASMLFASRKDDSSPTENVVDDILSLRVAVFTLITAPLHALALTVVCRLASRRADLSRYPLGMRSLVLLCATYAASYQTAWTNVLGKLIGVLATTEPLSSPALWLLVAMVLVNAPVQLSLVSCMMRLFDAVVCIPPYQILILLWLVGFSTVAFGESPQNPAAFVAALFVAFGGIYFVTAYAPVHPLRVDTRVNLAVPPSPSGVHAPLVAQHV